MPATTEIPSATWIGWRRPSGERWRAVSSGDTEAEASARLLAVADRDRSGHYDNVVLPQGIKP